MKNALKRIHVRSVSPVVAAVLSALACLATAQAKDVVQVTHAAFGYVAGAKQVIECTVSYPAGRQLRSLLWMPNLPPNWTMDRAPAATTGDGLPEVDPDGAVIFMDQNLSAHNPLVFRFTVNVPPGEVGERTVRGTVECQLDGMANPATVIPTDLVLADAYATHAATGYLAGTPLTVTCTFALPQGVQTRSLLWQPELPPGWVLTTASGMGSPEVSADHEAVVFVGNLTASTVSFTYTVTVPDSAAGPKNVGGFAEYQLPGMANPVSLRARPDPLVLRPMHTLQVVSAYGTATPAVGTYTNFYGDTLTPSTTASQTIGNRTFACTGWDMVGNVPATGPGTNFSMTVTGNAVLTWNWAAPLITTPAGGGSLSTEMNEDGTWTPPTIVATAVSYPGTSNAGTLTWTPVSDASHGSATVSGTGTASPTLSYTPTANWNGSDSFVIQVANGQGGREVFTVNVTVLPVNDVPSFTKGSDLSVSEDAAAQSVPAWATAITDGDDDVVQALTFNVTNNNTTLFSAQPSVSTNGTLSYTPATNANGIATVTVSLTDDGTAGGAALTTAPQTFTITVGAVNDMPSFTKGANQSVAEDCGAQTVTTWATAISDGDAEVEQALTFNVSNNNNALFSTQPSVTADGALSYTPSANANGTATVTVTLTDDGNAGGAARTTLDQTFTITVSAVNDLPRFTLIGAQSVAEDCGPQSEATGATAIDDGDPEVGQTLTFNVTNNNTTLFSAQPSVSTNGTLTYTPAPNAYGFATVTVSLTDDATAGTAALTTAPQTFTITVNAVNDTPSFTKGANQSGVEDCGAKSVANWATAITDSDAGVDQSLTFNVSNNNNAMFSTQPTITSGGTLNYTPATNANGTATVTVTLTDDGQAGGAALTSGAQTFTITLSAYNDPPVITGGIPVPPVGVNELTPLTFTLAVTDPEVPPQPLYASTLQTLHYSLENAPAGAAINASGDFTWTPTETQGPGDYTFDVVVTDGVVSPPTTLTSESFESHVPGTSVGGFGGGGAGGGGTPPPPPPPGFFGPHGPARVGGGGGGVDRHGRGCDQHLRRTGGLCGGDALGGYPYQHAAGGLGPVVGGEYQR